MSPLWSQPVSLMIMTLSGIECYRVYVAGPRTEDFRDPPVMRGCLPPQHVAAFIRAVALPRHVVSKFSRPNLRILPCSLVPFAPGLHSAPTLPRER